ncbi:MAG: rhomboid family intramembrane serine protease [Verrucomicrobiales bacterium]|nr:rhomboid family intramembrane serine protease [Verrucomicrobiales bacterium]
MAYGFGSKLIDSTERKFGHLAIPGLLRWVGGFQLIVFILSAIDPNYWSMIAFDRDAIFSGQVWRLFSYLFFPRTTSMWWILFSIMFLWFINTGLESAWGSFRTNLYLYATLLCATTLGLLFPHMSKDGAALSMLVYSNLFFAFASLYPEQEILLFLIIPVKIKYLAWIGAAILILSALASPLTGLFTLCALLPLFAVFGPNFIRNARQRKQASTRRAKFQMDTRGPAGDAFHVCSICGIDDVSDPATEFRVAADGDEYCELCLKTKQEEEGQSSSA